MSRGGKSRSNYRLGPHRYWEKRVGRQTHFGRPGVRWLSGSRLRPRRRGGLQRCNGGLSTHHLELICSTTTSPALDTVGSSLSSAPYSTSISIAWPMGDFRWRTVLLTGIVLGGAWPWLGLAAAVTAFWLFSMASLLRRSPSPFRGTLSLLWGVGWGGEQKETRLVEGPS